MGGCSQERGRHIMDKLLLNIIFSDLTDLYNPTSYVGWGNSTLLNWLREIETCQRHPTRKTSYDYKNTHTLRWH